jgi:diguanylate cyclase (GGDEF)-like protein/PAS domain S-box-containing protein
MSEPIKILMVEDVVTDAELMLRELKRAGLRCDSRRVDTQAEYQKQLEAFRPDVILSDFSMPHFDGMEALRIAAQSYPHIPFIFISGTLGEEYAVRALKNGATDFVLKTNLIRLPPSIERAIAEAQTRKARQVLEQQIRESEERFRQLAENISEVFWVHDVATDDSLYISPAYERVWQSPVGAVKRVHHDWAQSLHPQDRAAVLELFGQMVKGLKPFDIDYRIVVPDGSVRWIHDRGFPVRDAHGQIYRTAGLAEDVTESMQLKVALQEQAAGLQRAQLLAKQAHVITGKAGSFVRWSDTLPLLIGVLPHGVPTDTRAWMQFIHAEDRANFREKSIDAARTGRRVDVDYRLWRADGELIHVRQVIEPLERKDADQDEALWFCTIQDVTGQRRVEERVKRLNRVHSVLSGINALIVRIRDREELCREACHIAVEQGGFTVGWMSVYDAATGMLSPVARAGLSANSVLAEAPVWLTPAGAAATALQEKRPVFDNDIGSPGRSPANASTAGSGASTLDTLSIRRAAIQMGAKSVIVLPVLVEQKIFGVLTLYAPERDFFDDEEVKLLTQLSADVSFGLEFIAKEEKVDYLAYYDALTGLPNSALFHDRLTQFLHAAARSAQGVAAIVINLDRFRNLNNSLGRHAGDALLKLVGIRLGEVLREPFSIARTTGDTFAVAIADLKQAADVVDLLEDRIFPALVQPLTLDATEVRLSARAGIALFPSDGADAETLYRNAEAALKHAKSSGEQYLFYAPEMNARVAEKVALENNLRQAIEREEFVLYYQPKVRIADGRICGLEALIRWNNPKLGLVPPLRFIPLLEETGLVLQVGAWALKQAMTDYRALLVKRIACPRIAVNMSPLQLRQKDFAKSVNRAVGWGTDQIEGLELEITESVIMENIENNIAQLKAMQSMGVSIAIDDFGTGYSSLAYIAKLPVNTLKVDRSFVLAMNHSAEDRNIVSTIISLAHSLDMKVVAEGVETQEQLDLLRGLQCDEMQGYLFSAPLPIAQIEDMLRRLAG